MKVFLTPEQIENQQRFRDFVKQNILPVADKIDEKQNVPDEIIAAIAREGYLGALTPGDFEGADMDLITYGLLNEEFGQGCSSVRTLITVQNMVSGIIRRWGSPRQKEQWLRSLATGEKIASFALTEPEHGSDAYNLETTIAEERDHLIINGRKKWISFGQIADLFITFGQSDKRLRAVIIERDTPGLMINPQKDHLGLRGSMLAEIRFNNCRILKENQIGGTGFGLNPVGFTALDLGRYSIAWGCVGMAAACLDSSITYAGERKQFGVKLSENQLIKRLLTNMMTDAEAARLLCYKAGVLKEENDPGAINAVMMAKYYASGMAVRVAGDAVQIHGANGFSRNYPVERFYRDAKIMTMIEGSDQMMQLMISKYGGLS